MATKRIKQEADVTDNGAASYKTSEKKSASFDVLVRGELIVGEWDKAREYVKFKVPAELVEPFEEHWHFKVGNIVKE